MVQASAEPAEEAGKADSAGKADAGKADAAAGKKAAAAGKADEAAAGKADKAPAPPAAPVAAKPAPVAATPAAPPPKEAPPAAPAAPMMHPAGQPCPCLNTPPPLVSADETRALEIKAAADNAMLLGLTRIEEAAKGSGSPFVKELKELKPEDLEKDAQAAFVAAEKNQSSAFKQEFEGEVARQEKELIEMEAHAEYAAKITSQHLRETAEQWAENQAKNYIVMSTNGTMANALNVAQSTATIRQEATELAKGAIKSAAESLEVAKEAQLAIEKVPQSSMKKARKNAVDLKNEQKALNGEIEFAEHQARRVAQVAMESHNTALFVEREADIAEKRAKKALDTARGNSEKIAKLKDRVQELSKKTQALAAKK